MQVVGRAPTIRPSSSDSGAPDSYPGGGLCNSGVGLHFRMRHRMARYRTFNPTASCPWWVRFPLHAPGSWSVKRSGHLTGLLNRGNPSGFVNRVHCAPPTLESEAARVLPPAGNRLVSSRAWLSTSPALRHSGTSSSQGAAAASKADGVTVWHDFRLVGVPPDLWKVSLPGSGWP